MADKPNTAGPGKARRRWYQFRLRTLLIVVTIASVLCPIGVRYYRRRQDERISRALQETGAFEEALHQQSLRSGLSELKR